MWARVRSGGEGDTRWWDGPGAARIAKAPIVYQPQGDERDTQWWERPGRALLAKAPIELNRFAVVGVSA
jgi:hypothetical protein